MATPNRPANEAPAAAGTDGDGQDNYPTYRDRPGSSPADGSRPTDSNLPQRRRTSATPMLIGVVAFAIVVGIYVIWSVVHMASAPSTGPLPSASTSSDTSGDSGLNRTIQSQTTAPGPATTPATPGAIDVPGGNSSSSAPASTTP